MHRHPLLLRLEQLFHFKWFLSHLANAIMQATTASGKDLGIHFRLQQKVVYAAEE